VWLPTASVLVVGLSGFSGLSFAGSEPETPTIRLQLSLDLDVRFAMRLDS
jgi:hypothetical protein